ncbi:MAG: BrnA antitoxin family protein [Zoogloeaceae bacterium]|jgi:uncharacterized protein (DUF4415 family)|nr:BrnA antitoxin family protein [Zoogloeaceae bacterium]
MSDLPPHPDPEMNEFEQALLRSLEQAKRGEYARVSTPEDIVARRRGRPVGSFKAQKKIQTAIRFDPDVLAGLRALGRGWQTRANDALREWLRNHEKANRSNPATTN